MTRWVRHLLSAMAVAALGLVPAVRAQEEPGAEGMELRRVERLGDLPVHAYVLEQPLAEAVASREELRRAAAQALFDLGRDLEGCTLASDAARQEVAHARLELQLLLGQDEEALASLRRLRELEDEEAERRTSALAEEAWLLARAEAGRRASVQALRPLFEQRLGELVSGLPPELVRGELERSRTWAWMTSEAWLDFGLERALQAVERAGAADLGTLVRLASLHNAREILLPFRDVVVSITTRFLAGAPREEEIWSGREVALGDEEGAPVVVAIWDTGVDLSLFEGRLWTNPAEHADGRDADGNGFVDDLHGIAFTPGLEPTPELLYPADDAELAQAREWTPALQDLSAGIDDERTRALRRHLESLDPEGWRRLLETLALHSARCHGTHVADVALRGNPHARLLAVRVGMDHRPEAVPMTVEWARSFAGSCRRTVEYLERAGARVVNLSWGWSLPEIVASLEAHGVGADRPERLERAEEVHGVLASGMREALAGAPGILFVCAAGNSGEDQERERLVPATLDLPNLIVVGAVDDAGAVTAFTSFGPDVDVFANGSRVEGRVPGGERLRLSGTSMAAPQATNLAAKLLALDPSLEPAAVKELVVHGGERVERGGRELVLLHPARTVELLRAE